MPGCISKRNQTPPLSQVKLYSTLNTQLIAGCLLQLGRLSQLAVATRSMATPSTVDKRGCIHPCRHHIPPWGCHVPPWDVGGNSGVQNTAWKLLSFVPYLGSTGELCAPSLA